MAIQIQLRRGTSVQWAAANTLLAEAEIAVELDTYQYKIGDGYTNWSDLPYSGMRTTISGNDTEVIFNNNNLANGSASFTFNYATNTLNISNTLIVTNTISTGNLIASNARIDGLTVNNNLTVIGEFVVSSNLEIYDTLSVNNNINVLNTITTNNSIVYSTLDVYDTLNVNNTLVISNTASIANILTFGNNFILGANLNNGELEQIGPALVIGTDASILTNGPDSTPWYAPQGGSFATEQHLFFANASLVQVGNSSSYFNLYNDSLSFYDAAGNKAGSISVASLDVDSLTANTLVIDGISSGSVGSDSITANTISVTTSISVGDETTGISINATSFSGTSNNTLYVGDVYYDNVVSNSQLSSNLANYSNTSLMLANDATTYSNAVYYTDVAIGLVNTAFTSNVITAYSNAVYYTDTVIGNVNTAISSNATTTYSNAVYYTDTVIGNVNTAITANSDTAYTNAVAFAANASNISNGTLDEERLPYRMDQDVRKEDDVEFHNITVTGMIVSGNVTVIGSNNLAISDNMIYLNANSTVTNPDLGFVGNYNDGIYHHTGFFRDASDGIWKVFENYEPEPDASPYINTGNNTFRIANFQANTIYIGNTSTYATINNTSYSGTSNNTLYVGSVSAIDVVSNAQLIANLANFQLTANLTSEVFKITANNATYAFGKTQSALNVNNALTSNNASYLNNKPEANLNVNTALTSNNASYLNNKPEANLNVNTALTSNNASYLGNVASSFYINTSASYTITGVHTHNANIIIGSTATVSANGTVGTQGQVLTSNGSTIYWANPYSGFSNGQSISVNNFIITGSFTANGAIGSNGQVLTSNGTTTYWSSAAAAVSAVDATSQTFTGNGSNTVFTLATSVANQKNIIVSINGLLQVPVTHYSITGTTLTFTDAPYNSTIIEARSMEGLVLSSGGGSISSGDLFLGAMLLGGM